MAKHDVQFSVPPRRLRKADVEFKVKTDGAVVGMLRVSNGSIVWFPKGKGYGLKISWQKFDEYMRTNARESERR